MARAAAPRVSAAVTAYLLTLPNRSKTFRSVLETETHLRGHNSRSDWTNTWHIQDHDRRSLTVSDGTGDSNEQDGATDTGATVEVTCTLMMIVNHVVSDVIYTLDTDINNDCTD